MRDFMKVVVMLCLLMAAPVFADMTVVEKMNTGGMPGQAARTFVSTTYVKGQKARIESGDTAQIVDLQMGKVYTLDSERKEVMVVPLEVMKQAGNVLGQLGQKSMNSTFNKTGASQKINGFACSNYHLESSGSFVVTADYCISDTVDTKELEPFKPLMQDALKVLGSDVLSKTKGLPIQSKLRMTMMGQVIEGSTEVQSVSYQAVADSLFNVPKDFKVVQMPAMPQK